MIFLLKHCRIIKMKTIILLTDFGNSPYAGIMKGVIKSINPDVQIIDLYHAVKPQSIRESAFLLASCYSYFPARSIFVCVVDPGVGTKRNILLARTKKYFFIAPDNGLISPVLKKEAQEKIISIDNSKYFLKPVSNTFHGRDIFAPVAAHLSLGADISDFGTELKQVAELDPGKPKIKGNKLSGEIIFVDTFGNLVTNIPENILSKTAKNRITILINKKKITGLKNSYTAVRKGAPLAIIGSFGYLELSVRDGSAGGYFDAGVSTKVVVEKWD